MKEKILATRNEEGTENQAECLSQGCICSVRGAWRIIVLGQETGPLVGGRQSGTEIPAMKCTQENY